MEAKTMGIKTMDIKTSQQLTKPANTEAATHVPQKTAEQKAGNWIDFFSDVKLEFLKITWTSPEELRTYTKIVVGMTVFLGMGIYCMDLAIQIALGTLEAIMRLLG